MSWLLLVRGGTFALMAIVLGASLFGTWAARGTATAPPLAAISLLTASGGIGQALLLAAATPPTPGTWIAATAAVGAGGCLVWGVARGPDDPLVDLPERTRDLIRRHPELLEQFAQRLNHVDEETR